MNDIRFIPLVLNSNQMGTQLDMKLSLNKDLISILPGNTTDLIYTHYWTICGTVATDWRQCLGTETQYRMCTMC